MQFELRTQVIEPERKTFTNLVERYGDRPASRYEEGSIDIQADGELPLPPAVGPRTTSIYDADYTAFKLTDPYSFTDPRQLYYAPYVQSRAAMNDAFVKTVEYVESRDLLQKLPAGWDAARRRGPAPAAPLGGRRRAGQHRGLALGLRHHDRPVPAPTRPSTASATRRTSRASASSTPRATTTPSPRPRRSGSSDPALQGLRRLVEELLAERRLGQEAARPSTWPTGCSTRLMYTHLDEAALIGGAGAYSLSRSTSPSWFADQRRWLDHLVRPGSPTPSTATPTRPRSTTCSPPAGRRSSRPSPTSPPRSTPASTPAPSPTSSPPPPPLAADLGALGLTVPGGK